MTRRARAVPVGRVVAAMLAGAALAWSVSGCGPDPERTATRRATAQVRETAADARQAVHALLADPGAPQGQQLLDATAWLVEGGQLHGVVFGRRLGPGDQVSVDVAFDATAAASGIAPAEVTVRLCVRINGARGPEPHVAMVEVTCDPWVDRVRVQPDATVGLR